MNKMSKPHPCPLPETERGISDLSSFPCREGSRGVRSVLLAIILCSFFVACTIAPENPRIEKDGKVYGTTVGAFRHRWWNYYERGTSFSDGQFWKQAEADFKAAIDQRNSDQRRVRTYGRHLSDYFPHRELGVALFHQNRYVEAVRELEASLSSENSAKAEYYLDKARKARIEQEHSDKTPPVIQLDSPQPDALSDASAITVSGMISDDTFVKEITINGDPVRIDLSAPKISFHQQTRIRPGKNAVIIEAKDLIGKISRTEQYLHCDRAGPIVNIDPPEAASGAYLIKGYAHDASGIRRIRINDTEIDAKSEREFSVNQTIALASNQNIIVIAEDILGNQTRAEISPAIAPSAKKSCYFKPVLLASLDEIPLLCQAETGRGIMTEEKKERRHRRLGTYYALIIGINEYTEWPVLRTAVNDAMGVKEVLSSRYGFPEKNVTLRVDKAATRETLLEDMKRLAGTLKESDNLLLYFAGHGQLDPLTGDGYWIPVNGKRDDPSSWITNSAIKNFVGSDSFLGKNVLIIADSCYSGTLLREKGGTMASGQGSTGMTLPESGVRSRGVTVIPTARNLEDKVYGLGLKRSRQILASGGIESVSDEGKGNHSLFAYHLLNAFKKNPYRLIDIEYLYNSFIWKPVVDKGGQRPIMGRLQSSMDEDGQFVIVSGDESANKVLAGTDEDSELLQRSSRIDSDPPEIDIPGWTDKKTVFIEQALLQIITKDPGGIQSVSVNGQKIVSRPGKNKLHSNYVADLKEGDNSFSVECSDQLGNKGKKDIVIHRKLQKVYETGARLSLAAYPFKTEGKGAEGVEDMVINRLIQSKRFNIKERKKTDDSVKSTASDEQNDAVEFGKKAGADVVLIGKVSAKENSLQIEARIVDTGSAEVMTLQDVYGEAGEDELAKTLSQGLTVKLRAEFPLIEGRVIKIKDKEVIINLGEESRIKKGMRLIFFQEGEVIKDPKTGEILGSDSQELGAASIQKLMPKMSYAMPSDAAVLPKLNESHKVVMK